MLYLLDANVLIDANRDYYSLSRVPEFWEWLEDVGTRALVKIPVEIYEEIKDGKDDLAIWAKDHDVRSALIYAEEAEVTLVAQVTDQGYAPDLTDDEVEKIGRDPFLIAYALRAVTDRCIVTTEVSKPGRTRANRHLPDVCKDLGVNWCNTFAFVRDLDFTTGWSRT
ncbi:MAG: DUF4411 family protein [Anaerolineales bacterium]